MTTLFLGIGIGIVFTVILLVVAALMINSWLSREEEKQFDGQMWD